MAEHDESADGTPQPGDETRERAARRRRLAEVFGDALPEQTSDDLPEEDGSLPDDWYRAQVPPHHG